MLLLKIKDTSRGNKPCVCKPIPLHSWLPFFMSPLVPTAEQWVQLCLPTFLQCNKATEVKGLLPTTKAFLDTEKRATCEHCMFHGRTTLLRPSSRVTFTINYFSVHPISFKSPSLPTTQAVKETSGKFPPGHTSDDMKFGPPEHLLSQKARLW